MKKELLNLERMKIISLADIDQFKLIKKAAVTETKDGPLIFIDRGSKILAVAHLDSVKSTKHFYDVIIDGKHWVLNAQLDDRLGVYVILDLLPSLGINVDVLLTDSEESGLSTAKFFKSEKKYNWMFQFDRKGDDVVRYQYESTELENALKNAGFPHPTHGAFSDICRLSHLGCSGFNVGCGYDDEHSVWAKADMGILTSQIEKFRVFHKKFKNTYFPHVEKKTTIVQTHRNGRYWWDAYDDDDWSFERGMVVRTYCRYCHNTLGKRNTSKLFDNTCVTCANDMVKCKGDCDFYFSKKALGKSNGLCPTCEKARMANQMCIGCGEFFTLGELGEDSGLCKDCHTKAQVGIITTKLTCPECGTSLMSNELDNAEGICTLCLQHPGWWSYRLVKESVEVTGGG